jgi:hypothetical protein
MAGITARCVRKNGRSQFKNNRRRKQQKGFVHITFPAFIVNIPNQRPDSDKITGRGTPYALWKGAKMLYCCVCEETRIEYATCEKCETSALEKALDNIATLEDAITQHEAEALALRHENGEQAVRIAELEAFIRKLAHAITKDNMCEACPLLGDTCGGDPCDTPTCLESLLMVVNLTP